MTNLKTKKFPVLYKKTSTGKIQTWEIWVTDNVIHSESGQLDGKKIKSEDTIREGKNIGKTNETTPAAQALAEAESRWVGKTKKGYTLSVEGASSGIVEDIIEGGINPMLAKSYAEQGDKIKFPCAVQPKLDGIRCISINKSLWTRTRKPINSVPHILKDILETNNFKIVLDGELYNHKFKNDFEKITHIVNQKKEVSKDHEVVEYHVYDMPSNESFLNRNLELKEIFKKIPPASPLKLVETLIVNDELELEEAYEKFKRQGYEGAMVRNLDAPYEYKRSNHLQKIKEFEDSEFEIIGGEEGRGKLQGHLGAFICKTNDGTEFKVKMSGETKLLKHYWENLKHHLGMALTVKFQGLTGKSGVPRFPVGKAIRDYE